MDEKDYSDISIDIDLINGAYGTTDYFDYQDSISSTDLDAININDWGFDMSSYTITSSGAGSSGIYIDGAATTSASWATSVGTGIQIEKGHDLTIGDRSLSEFMDQVEERLGILRPNEGLENRWDQLKELRRQYQELEKDLLEKEKIMNILKDNHGR